MLTSKPEFTGRTVLSCPFFLLFWTLLIYPVKAARMCLRSAHYCKIKRSWLDRALPRKTQNLLIKKRFPADWSQQYSRCPSSHWIQAKPHSGQVSLPLSESCADTLPVSAVFVTSARKASMLLLVHRAHLIQQAAKETSPVFSQKLREIWMLTCCCQQNKKSP